MRCPKCNKDGQGYPRVKEGVYYCRACFKTTPIKEVEAYNEEIQTNS